MSKGLLDDKVQVYFTKKRCFDNERIRTPLYGELLSRDCLKTLLVLKQLCNLTKNYGRKSLGAFKPSWQTKDNWMVREQGSLSNIFSLTIGSLIVVIESFDMTISLYIWSLYRGSTLKYYLPSNCICLTLNMKLSCE